MYKTAYNIKVKSKFVSNTKNWKDSLVIIKHGFMSSKYDERKSLDLDTGLFEPVTGSQG